MTAGTAQATAQSAHGTAQIKLLYLLIRIDHGHVAVAVPGGVAGTFSIWRRFAIVPLRPRRRQALACTFSGSNPRPAAAVRAALEQAMALR